MATVKQAKSARHLMFNNHLKMYKMNENLAAKLEKGGPSDASLVPSTKSTSFLHRKASFSDGGGLSCSKMNENLAAKLGKRQIARQRRSDCVIKFN